MEKIGKSQFVERLFRETTQTYSLNSAPRRLGQGFELVLVISVWLLKPFHCSSNKIEPSLNQVAPASIASSQSLLIPIEQ